MLSIRFMADELPELSSSGVPAPAFAYTASTEPGREIKSLIAILD